MNEATKLESHMPPPGELSPDERQIWSDVVKSKPADWFQKDTEQLLIGYCKHCVQAALIDREMGACTDIGSDEALLRFEKLANMREKQSRIIAALSRSMRLSQQTKYDPKSAYRADQKANRSPKSWEHNPFDEF